MSSNEFNLSDSSKNVKKFGHRRIGSFPSIDNLLTKGKQMFSSPGESMSSVPRTLNEESNRVTFVSSRKLDEDEERDEDPLEISVHRRNHSDPFTSATAEESSKKPADNRLSLNMVDPSDSEQQTTSTKTKKKKPWYRPFQATYEERSSEFRKLFRELPSDERLISDYVCAWQKEILIQGRMYLGTSSLCFHSNILTWKHSLILKWKDIVDVTPEKTALLFDNAIEMKTSDGDKYFFASFTARDKTFDVIGVLWQAVTKHQPLPTDRLLSMIRENYDDDVKLEMNEAFEEISLPPPNEKRDQSETIPSNDEETTPTPMSEMHPRELVTVPSPSPSSMDPLRTETVEEEAFPYLSTCLCQDHYPHAFIHRKYSISVDQLFNYIFGDNDLLKKYHQARRIHQFRTDGWKWNDEKNRRERLCFYKVTANSMIGTTTVTTNEIQIINIEVPKSHYIVTTEIRNEGAKYADSFCVLSRYCLIQINSNETTLRVTSDIKYLKSVLSIAKTFIEKNTIAALQDSFNDLMKRIDDENPSKQSIEDVKQKPSPMKTRSSIPPSLEEQTSSTDPSQSPTLLPSSSPSSSIIERKPDEVRTRENLLSSPSQLSMPSTSTTSSIFYRQILIIILVLLLFVNIFLCLKLNEIDRMTDQLFQNYPSWLNKNAYPSDQDQWSVLLQKQEEFYRSQLSGLQMVLASTHNALKNVTETLNQLSKLSNKSN